MSYVPGDGGGWRQINIMCPGLVGDYTAPFKSVLHLQYLSMTQMFLVYCFPDFSVKIWKYEGNILIKSIISLLGMGAFVNLAN